MYRRIIQLGKWLVKSRLVKNTRALFTSLKDRLGAISREQILNLVAAGVGIFIGFVVLPSADGPNHEAKIIVEANGEFE